MSDTPKAVRNRNLWDWFRCVIGKPRCHRELRRGIDYAMCNWCNRQSEVHQLGGPPPRMLHTCLIKDCPHIAIDDGPFCKDHGWDDFADETRADPG